jgi:hypothetical protein
MSAFEFVFSLFGLLLGLSLVEVLAGLVRALKSRARVKVGWLTPLLGILTMIHVTTFWDDAWNQRDAIPPGNLTLFVGLLISGIYYYAASFVFPDRENEWADLDDYYDRNKKFVLGGIVACQLIASHAIMLLNGRSYTPGFLIGVSVFTALFVAPALVSNRRVSGALLAIATVIFGGVAIASSL